MNHRVLDLNGKPHGFRFDRDSEGLVVHDTLHNLLHRGKVFQTFYKNTTTNDDGHRSAILFKTPPEGVDVHMVVSFSASAAADFSLHRGVIFDAGEGTNGRAIFNRKHSSSNVSALLDNATPQVPNKVTTLLEAEIAAGNLNAGTIFLEESLTAGTGPKPAGGENRGDQEYELLADTWYMFMLTNTASNINIHTIVMDWYEITE